MSYSSNIENDLREVLEHKKCRSQHDILKFMSEKGYELNQSTVSRTLKKIGGIKGIDDSGQPRYLLLSPEPPPPQLGTSLGKMVQSLEANETLIVIRTRPGCASLIAGVLDQNLKEEILGTVAGDDTVFVTPRSIKKIRQTLDEVRDVL